MAPVAVLRVLVPLAACAVVGVSAGTAYAAAAVTVTPHSGLASSQTVSVAGSSWPASTTINLVECNLPVTGINNCDIGTLVQVTSDASGAFTTPFKAHTGVVGDGQCDPGETCVIALATADQSVTSQANITFAAPAPAPSASPSAHTSAGPSPSSTASAPASNGGAGGLSVDAGSGGQSGHRTPPYAAAGLAIAGGGFLLAAIRRRRLRGTSSS